MARLRAVLMMALATMCVGVTLVQQPSAQSRAPGEPVRLTVENNYPPFVDLAREDGGMAVEIVRRAFALAGIPVTLVERPWQRGLAELRQGTIFGSFPWADDPERRATYKLSAPLFDAVDDFYVRAAGPVRLTVEADLDGKRVCRPRGYGMFDRQPRVDAGAIIRVSPRDMATCFRLLEVGGVDVVWSERTEAMAVIAVLTGGADATRREPLEALRVTMHLMASRADPQVDDTLALFDAAIARMRAQGEIAAITARALARFANQLDGNAGK